MNNFLKTGCHYFFGCSPLNFWSNLDPKTITQGVAHVQELGFNSLFLLVPWAEFVDDRGSEPTMQGYCVDSYRAIAAECRNTGLDLHVRIAYLWEANPAGTTTFQRYANFFTDPLHSRSLTVLCRFLRGVEQEVGGKIQYFMSWEDPYWPIFSHWRSREEVDRRHLAEATGYRAFLDLQGVENNDMTVIPGVGEPELVNFCQFYDAIILTRFIRILHDELGHIGMEYRVDSDYIMDVGEHKQYYHWPLCHPLVKQKYVYYHPQLFGHSDDALSAEQSNERLKWVIHTAAPRINVGERPIIVDQFNFVDNTEMGWNRIDDKAVDDLMRLTSQEGLHRRAEIALWSTIDWPRDVIFNGTFSLGLEGWTASGLLPRLEREPVRSLMLEAGMSIEQRPILSFPTEQGFFVEIDYEIHDAEAGITISTDHQHVTQTLSQRTSSTLTLKMQHYAGILIIRCDTGSVRIRRVRMYDRYYSQGGRSPSGESTKSFDAFLRYFNGIEFVGE